jgi:hypothetical protein
MENNERLKQTLIKVCGILETLADTQGQSIASENELRALASELRYFRNKENN